MTDTVWRYVNGEWQAITANDTYLYKDGRWFNPCAQGEPDTLWFYKDGAWHKACPECVLGPCGSGAMAKGFATGLSLSIELERDLTCDSYIHVIGAVVCLTEAVGNLFQDTVSDSQGNVYVTNTNSLAVLGATRADTPYEEPTSTLMFGPSAISPLIPAGGLSAGDTIDITFWSAGTSDPNAYRCAAMAIPMKNHDRRKASDGFYFDGNAYPGGSDDPSGGTQLLWSNWGPGYSGLAEFRSPDFIGSVIVGFAGWNGTDDFVPADSTAVLLDQYHAPNGLYLTSHLIPGLSDEAEFEPGGTFGSGYEMLAGNYQSLTLLCP